MRMLKKDRPENDPTKALEFTGAMTDLAHAFKVFKHLREEVGPKLSGIEDEKVEKHLIFCRQTHEKGTLLLKQASRPFTQSNSVTTSQPRMPTGLWHTFKLPKYLDGIQEGATTSENLRLVRQASGHSCLSQCLLTLRHTKEGGTNSTALGGLSSASRAAEAPVLPPAVMNLLRAEHCCALQV